MTADDTPLLPEALRAYPYAWWDGRAWPVETEESEENLAYARAVLEACLPPEPLAEPLPPEEIRLKDLPEADWPEWVVRRDVLLERMPSARDVTVERMAEAEAEWARQGRDTTDFAARSVRLMTSWIAEATLHWCGLYVDDEAAMTPWLMDLAEQFVLRGMAAEQAAWALKTTWRVPASVAALGRLATVDGLPDEVRSLVEGALEQAAREGS
ncbi:hypothetical protein ACGFMM_19735 [Streptomyces sp. NPDC048604]|uniref:hypothetical protein n=1 Tax=Streptomyces sp. NPDC048604 TaxID=3365578 RepID=UPI00371AF03F